MILGVAGRHVVLVNTWCGSKMLLLACLCILFSNALADSTTTSDLLWPQPSSMTFGSNVYTLDDRFVFLTAGDGGESDILRGAITRYQKLIFQTPTPFYPSGGSAAATGSLASLTVSVSSNDETLGLKTDESCKWDIIIMSNNKKITIYYLLQTLWL